MKAEKKNRKGMFFMTKERKALYRIVVIGLMAALVYVGNYLQIKIPNGVFITRIHLGNSMCLLAGLLFGGLNGGLSSGIGAAMFDLFDPVYITSAWYTFISKFAMGFTAGALRRAGKNPTSAVSVTISAIIGQVVYIVLYLGKSLVKSLLLGNALGTALTEVGTNAVASTVNAALAVIIAVPLYFALRKALMHTPFYQLIDGENAQTA